MSAAKQKQRLSRKKNPRRSVASAAATRTQYPTWDVRFEACVGWLACLIIIVAPLVFHSRMINFADLPQRVFIQGAVALLCALGLLGDAVRLRCDLPRDMCSCLAAAFACWALVSVFWSTSLYDALYASLHWAACILALLGFVSWLHQDLWLRRFAVSVVVSSALVNAVALAQLFLKMRVIPFVGMPASAFANPNVLAEFLSMTLIYCVCAGLLSRRRPLASVLCWSAAASHLLVLYYTGCRSAWVAVVVAVLWCMLLYCKTRTGWRYVLPALIIAACAFVFSVFSLSARPEIRRSLDGSAVYRLIVWENTVELVRQKPFSGYGAGSFPYMYGSVLNTHQSDTTFGKQRQIRRAHNDFLQTAAELGLPGAGLLVLFFGGVLTLSLRLSDAQRSYLERFVLYACSGALAAFLVTSFFGFPLQRSVTPFLAFSSAALIIALYCRQNDAFFRIRQRGRLIAAALIVVAAGAVLLRYNLAIIDSDVYYKKALGMERRGANARALAFSRRAHELCPGRMDVLTTFGRACVTTERLDEGIKALETVADRQPYHLNALFILGTGYANAGRPADALETFRRVLDIKPDFIEAKRIVSRLKAQGRVKVNLK